MINITKFGNKLAISLKLKEHLKAKKSNTKERSNCACARVILIDSDCRKDEIHYPKVFLEKYNLVTVEKKISVSNDDVEIYSNDSDNKYFDDSHDSDKENSYRKIRKKKVSCINLFKKKARKF